ncbi:aspartate aminotransferase, class I and II aminotransferase [Campylobacter blaseri]|uniref:Aspartate aminotransferase n=1 Tax=Campylobacter blaseri TaxID=2042961 RepID=A0A2P8QYV2_9BACT|nr:pyridoxal phosphate-dependent aminotransferase [Campylobacter blaseri]PSM51423.1 aspartate aminotransferase [Campylobacter blaseri]PSM52872.1 aspartate aminotransferase [Campylobacter blaseri]QKF86177.1 aspartate aminotransferase, class I and II aminotransferase [Campylobacter blaseri]
MLSKRVQTLSESITIAISSLAKEMKANGEDVISLSAGEPDFDTPKAIKDAAIEAMRKGCGKYTPIPGTNEVLKAIAIKLKRDNNLEYKPSQIITNVGAKHSLFNIIQCLIDEGDEVLIPAPYWVSYPEMTKYASGIPVILNTDESNGFKITAKQLKKAITTKTKLLMLNSPSNPCGTVYTKEDLLELAEVLKGTNIFIASDEIYEKVNYSGNFCATASVSKDMFKRTITINGLSKCGAMPGWRFGYMASANDELNKAVRKLQSQSTSNISSITQAGAIPALLGEVDDEIENMLKSYRERRDYLFKELNNIKGLKTLNPDGAFYLFINCKEIEEDSMKFCKRMLEEIKVATVPGVAFGLEGYFRVSFATDLESIKIATQRLQKFINNY